MKAIKDLIYWINKKDGKQWKTLWKYKQWLFYRRSRLWVEPGNDLVNWLKWSSLGRRTRHLYSFKKYNYLLFLQNCSSFFTGLHPGLTLHDQSALTKSVGYYMLSVILLVFYFIHFIVVEVNHNYHSFKTISPLLTGSNPPGLILHTQLALTKFGRRLRYPLK